MTSINLTPRDRGRLLEILRNRDTPSHMPYPRRYLARADLYLREYGLDNEVLEARQLLENRLVYMGGKMY
jgi:hypothetical protein